MEVDNKEDIKLFLLNIEKELEINIIFACETGSRSIGVDVETSDFDVKGFYLLKSEEQYLKVIRTVNPIILKHHLQIKLKNERIYDFDLELRDLKTYFYDKIKFNCKRSDFWFYSNIIYLNKFNDKDLNYFKDKILKFDVFIFSKFDKSGIETLKNKLVKKNNSNSTSEKILNKKLLSLLISIIQFMHTQVFNDFPFYNIFEEIKFLKLNFAEKNEIICKFFDEKELSLIDKNLNLVEGLYVRKKQGRLSETNCIPEILIEFENMIFDKFQPENLKKMNNVKKTKKEYWIDNIDIEWAEDLIQRYS